METNLNNKTWDKPSKNMETNINNPTNFGCLHQECLFEMCFVDMNLITLISFSQTDDVEQNPLRSSYTQALAVIYSLAYRK